MAVNYGFEKIRFVAPVRSGSRVRAKFKLLGVTPRHPQEFMTKSDAVVEIEGLDKPAFVAEWLGVSYFSEPITA